MSSQIRFATVPLLLSLCCLGGCSGVPAYPRSGGAGAERAALPPAAPGFSRVLDAVLVRGSWQDLRIDAECRDEVPRLRSILLFGTGVGIWNQERQLAVPHERLLGTLELLRRAGFGEMRESYGGKGTGGEERWRVEMICRVRAALDGVEKQSIQLSEGTQSAELKELAEQILSLGEELAPAGATASSLEDGLGKIARGELAPETLTLQLQRQAEDPAISEGGWILRIEGGKAQVSLPSAETAWTEPRRIGLAREETAVLAGQLAAAHLEDLPVNLYSSWYQDLEIRVLDQRKSVLARRFANLTPESHGDRQKRFDRVIALLEAVKDRVEDPAPNL